MTLQQLRALCEIADRGLNFSRTASALNTTQPAISRMIRSLEQELGTDLLVRFGTRMLRLTPQGEEAVARARQILLEVANLGRMGGDQKDARTGVMRVATTHTQASYGLVGAIKQFKTQYPNVSLQLRQGTPGDIALWVSKGEVDVGINARPQTVPANVITLDAYRIERCVIAPPGHPILKVKKPLAKDIAKYPIIDYDERAQTSTLLRDIFAKAGVEPQIAVTATDASAVMAYVQAGIGIAMLQKQIIRHEGHKRIRAIDASH
ncbi:MAG TPA: LysR substrate-binding domain-containing protein, partial [Burkholderiales bacterium]|nr:LysR substrate-binding domain-containing protein [Burkholderiales bacterium]